MNCWKSWSVMESGDQKHCLEKVLGKQSLNLKSMKWNWGLNWWNRTVLRMYVQWLHGRLPWWYFDIGSWYTLYILGWSENGWVRAGCFVLEYLGVPSIHRPSWHCFEIVCWKLLSTWQIVSEKPRKLKNFVALRLRLCWCSIDCTGILKFEAMVDSVSQESPDTLTQECSPTHPRIIPGWTMYPRKPQILWHRAPSSHPPILGSSSDGLPILTS